MGSDKPAGVRRDDKCSVNMEGSGDNEEPNLICDYLVPENGVLCINLLFGDCCQREDDNELFESVWNSRAEGQTSFAVYSPAHGDDPCGQIMTRTRPNDLPYLPGGSSGQQTTSGAALEGSNGDGDDAAAETNTGKNEKKKKRAVRGIRGGRSRRCGTALTTQATAVASLHQCQREREILPVVKVVSKS